MSSSLEQFHWLDFVIFALILLISCGVGVYYAVKTKKQDTDEYLLGSRQMSWFPVALSLVVSYTSGITQLGKPAEIYQYGVQYVVGVIGSICGICVCSVTFVPMLFRLQLTSSYEYLELRYQSKAVRCMGSMFIIISQLIYTGIATFSPAIALEAVTGIPVFATILCLGGVATFYTLLGGIKAVVSTDAFQAFVMLASILTIITAGLVHVGGVANMWEINKQNGRINIFNFDPDPLVRMSFWSLVVGKFFSWLPFYSVHQTSVQRYMCVPTLRKAQKIVLLNCPSFVFIDLAMCLTGLILFSYFSDCDPLEHPDPNLRIPSPNQLIPVFVMKVMGWPGVPGIFLAAIFSGSLSTVSSALNALATMTWQDFLQWKLAYLSDRTKTHVLRGLVYGVGGVVFAFLASGLKGHVLQVSASFLDTSLAPLMGIFILGAFFRRANWLGAMAGCVVGLVLPMWMSLGSYLAFSGFPSLPTSTQGCVWNGTFSANVTTVAPTLDTNVEGLHKLYSVSFMWFPTIGTLSTVLVGLLVSVVSAPFIRSKQPDDIKEEFIIFAVDSCWRKNRSKKFVVKGDAVDQTELKELKS